MKELLVLLLAFVCHCSCVAQDSSLLLSSLPPGLLDKISMSNERMVNKIQKQNQKLLKSLHAKEIIVCEQINSFDSMGPKEIEADIDLKYRALQKKISSASSRFNPDNPGQYIPRIDSLQTMLKFLKPIESSKFPVEKVLSGLGELKTKLGDAEGIKSFVVEREKVFEDLLKTYTKLPAGITKTINRYSKELYYYKQRISSWKETIKDPEKIEKEALQMLNKLPAFKIFFQQNSELSEVFGSPPATGLLTGLQTRQSVMQDLQQRLGSSANNPQQMLQQKLSAAQGELLALKENANEIKSGITGKKNERSQGIKSNSQKTKPFLKRIEVGCNLQMGSNPVQNIGSYPSTNDLALSAGYKINDRFVVGIGLAYKFSLGEGWKHISYSTEGIGLRNFIDWKISSPEKGLKSLFSNWWISGGYELNYRTVITSYQQLKNKSGWQQSGLLGLTKKMPLQTKFLKQANMQVLWDFLSYQQVPRTSAVIFRVGYSIK